MEPTDREQLKERDSERNEAEARLHARISELQSALQEQEEHYKVLYKVHERMDAHFSAKRIDLEKRFKEDQRTIIELQKELTQKEELEANLHVQMKEMEKNEQERKDQLKKLEEELANLHVQMKEMEKKEQPKDNKKELHRREAKEEEQLNERDLERNKAEATLRARVSELESALRDQREDYEKRLEVRERMEISSRDVIDSKQEGIYENQRIIIELTANIHCQCEENRIICTERERLIQQINKLEDKDREINCRIEEVEANLQDLGGKMKKLVVASVAVGVVAAAGWWFFS